MELGQAKNAMELLQNKGFIKLMPAGHYAAVDSYEEHQAIMQQREQEALNS